MQEEQAHKLVLNKIITSNLELKPLHTLYNWWVLADGGSSEKICLRFKNSGIAQMFYNAVQLAVGQVQLNQIKGVEERDRQDVEDESNETNFTMTKSKEILESKKEEFVFSSPNKYSFELKPRSPRRTSCGEGVDSDGNVSKDYGEHIYFKPVIPLPDKIEVKTGEEDEQVLYCHRAKLFTNSEWKERGVGDIKILKHSITGKLRVLMRREQVLKICLNHYLTSDIDYKAKDDRTWLFSAADYSEGEISCQQFCIRFKNGEIAKQFIDAVDNARSSTATKSTSVLKEESDDTTFSLSPTTSLNLGTPPTSLTQKAFNSFGVTISAAATPTTKQQVIFSYTTPDSSESTNKSPLTPVKLPSPTIGSICSMPKDNIFSRGSIISGAPKPEENLFGTNIVTNTLSTENKGAIANSQSIFSRNTSLPENESGTLFGKKDAAVTHILEQNNIMDKSHFNILDELRNIKDVIINVIILFIFLSILFCFCFCRNELFFICTL